MSEPLADPIDAYSLLSKDPREVTDAEALIIVEDLRRRREAYIKTGKPDKPRKERVVPGPKADAEQKKRNTAALLAQLKIPGVE